MPTPTKPKPTTTTNTTTTTTRRNIAPYQQTGGKHKLAAPLVSACRHLLKPNGSILGDQVANAILPNFPDLCSALPADYFANRQALLGTDSKRRPLTHSRIRNFILKELGPQLHQLGYGRGDRMALVLPNGPELALAILGVSHWAACLPLNANGAPSELQKDLKLAKAKVIIGMDGEESIVIRDMARALHIPFCSLVPSKTEIGIFHLVPSSIGDIALDGFLTPNTSTTTKPSNTTATTTTDATATVPDTQMPPAEDGDLCGICASNSYKRVDSMEVLFPNEHDDEVLILFTSGTTGNKKLVPHTLADMLIAAACIAVSWNLSPEDVNCNLMPLFHVGGIVRQVFAPILSAGSVICCPSFDPTLFWQLLLTPETIIPTEVGSNLVTTFSWYYAAPTMHQVILESMPAALDAYRNSGGNKKKKQQYQPKLRMIANAAGGLLPSLAEELRKAFGGANILPSYGMTECMPISSPPYDYELTKPGTSGVAVGPQITIFNSNFEILAPGKEGSICVRGRPCFHGYGGQPKESSFLEGGWFNTGDLGYLDEDGYLYITGRSKEVINRGGEIISPMEVEEEVLSHPSVMACAAFSASHDVLQEVVGIVVVSSPSMPKIDLPSLHDYLQSRLATAKWPQVLVFMDALPKSHTNKLLRVKLGQRLNLPTMNDGMLPIERTFEATCPPQGTPVGVAIPCERISIDVDHVQTVLQSIFGLGNPELLVTNHPTRLGSVIVHVKNLDRREIIEAAKESLDAFLQPSHVCLHTDDAPLKMEECSKVIPQSVDAVGFLVMANDDAGGNATAVLDPMIKELQELIQDLVDLDCLPSPDTSFFQIGGTSLLASQLASKIRKKYKVSFSGADIFRHNSCFAIAKKVKSQKPEFQDEKGDSQKDDNGKASTNGKPLAPNLQGVTFDPTRLKPRKNFLTGLLQTLPGLFVFPVWQFSRFFLFFVSLLQVLHRVPWEKNLYKFIVTLVVFHFLWNLLSPLVFVLIKWIVIGKYRKGRYAVWSFYYIRWWFVDVCRKIFGKGVWGSTNKMNAIFYRMLGADVAMDARFSIEADIAEYDLVKIGSNACIEYATVRGFGLDNGAMMLGPVEVGKSSSVGVRSVVAPFTRVPDGTHVGPGTSSYEISQDDSHLRSNRYSVEEPNLIMQMFVGAPITFLVDTFSHLPAMYVLYLMIIMRSHEYDDGDYSFENIGDLLQWLADPARIPYYLGIRVVRAIFAPILYMMGALLVKLTIIGKFRPGPRDTTSQWQLMRHWLAAALFSRENVQNVANLLGRHYELTSSLYRMLGAKVGKRVFWPGHQPTFSGGEFDLLEVGDDVVFGSRSVIFMSTSHTYEKVIFCAGANISDNTIVLPGSIIAKNAVLGSNTVCPVGRYLPPATTWLGSRFGEPILLEADSEDDDQIIFSKDVKESDIELDGDESTIRPFGRAVYLGGAKYFVCPPFLMAFVNMMNEGLLSIYHSLPLLGTVYLAAYQIYGPRAFRDYDALFISTIDSYKIMILDFLLLHCVRLLGCFATEIGAKWLLMGRRSMGRYNWDESSYNQRWEFYQLISNIRSLHRVSTLDFIAGTPFIEWYFRALGSKVGKDCCLYPAGGDPYMPEPDLVTFGDGVVLDIASVVCHLNTRGNFELVPIKMESNSTLRTRARVQQGVHVEAGSMLLEKSLALTGEVIESNSIWQGAPAQRITEYSPSLALAPSVSFGVEESEKYYELV